MTRYTDPDDTDHLDLEDQVADYEQQAPPPRWYKKGDPIPHLDLEVLLAFENEHPAGSAHKEGAIGQTFGLRPIHYYQQLNQAIDNPDAIALDPILCRRLQDTRNARLTARASRRPTK